MSEAPADGRDGQRAEPFAGDAGGSGAPEPEGEVAEALARVHQAVIDVKEGDLRESLEVAIDAIDSSIETSVEEPEPELCNVADALEQALDEVEKGKVANLLPVIKQAQSIVQVETGEDRSLSAPPRGRSDQWHRSPSARYANKS